MIESINKLPGEKTITERIVRKIMQAKKRFKLWKKTFLENRCSLTTLCFSTKRSPFLSLKVKVMVKRGCEINLTWNVINGHPITHPRRTHKKKPESFVKKTKRHRVRYIEKQHVIHSSSYMRIWNDTSRKRHSSMNIHRGISQLSLEDQLCQCSPRSLSTHGRRWTNSSHERVVELWVSKARPISHNRCNPLSASLMMDSCRSQVKKSSKSSKSGGWKSVENNHQKSSKSDRNGSCPEKKIMSTLSHLGTMKVHRHKVVKSIAEWRHPRGHSSQKTV